MLSFEWLIDPIAPETFFKNYYESRHLLIEARDPCKFSSLLSVATIDRYLADSATFHPDVFLVDASREIKPEEYTSANSEPAGRIDLARAYQLIRSGATISLGQMHERLPELGALCRAVETVFSGHFQTNIYLSPPNAQGFKTHFDSHDVFVLQVSGSKCWTVYDTLIELPLHGQAFEPAKHNPGPPTQEMTLRAGDVFYCPRGLFHSARSTDEMSLHITLGLIGTTWTDVMTEAVSEACLASPEFRRNLPIGFAHSGFDKRKAEAVFRSLIEKFSREANFGPILSKAAERFIASRRPDYSGCLQLVEKPLQISLRTRVAARPHLMCQVSEEGDNINVSFGSTKISFPLFTSDAVRFALSHEGEFEVRELPGRLDDTGKTVLVTRLIDEGLLVRRAEVQLQSVFAGAYEVPLH